MSTNGQGGAGGRRPGVAVPDLIWAPLAVGSLLAAIGLIGVAAGQPWLFPSLGPSAFLQAEKPGDKSARSYNTVVGHLVGLAAGVVAVLLLGASDAPGVLATRELVPIRVGAATLATVLTMLGLGLLRASHPPAAATMLLVALGGFPPTWTTAGTVAAGVLILAVLGEGVRWLRRSIFPAPDSRGQGPAAGDLVG
ncbi:HPP family protein [Tautonia plasticadhaerens]|uniref:HPP family protein n=1 Tax=Tautonia plasticadhaerens TaxID=2527974 RepID=A0A518H0N4_9BACT|nr:HPP family protein [Tautonia plasticadhaerens]QDV34399.1 HPP family protein [Tautonia plasticadhaerens]